MYTTDLFYVAVSISIYCKNVKRTFIYILHLVYVLFIWRKLDGCIYMHLSSVEPNYNNVNDKNKQKNQLN